jgi:hypothetical protein
MTDDIRRFIRLIESVNRQFDPNTVAQLLSDRRVARGVNIRHYIRLLESALSTISVTLKTGGCYTETDVPPQDIEVWNGKRWIRLV